MSKISEIVSPEYVNMYSRWYKWRLTYAGGDNFLDEYLKQLSSRETVTDFNVRKAITYIPAFAKAAVNDVKNAIFQRAADIRRQSPSTSYLQAITGLNGGVDLKSKTMNAFIGMDVLPELLSMAAVGVYVDNHIDVGTTLADNAGKHPYMYTFPVEDIRAYTMGANCEFNTLLLRESINEVDKDFGLPTANILRFRYMTLVDGGVKTIIYDKDGVEIEGSFLDIPKIPFVLFELSDSLLSDICNYQIAHLNLASSDIYYAITSNYPFYTEQFDPRTEIAALLRQALSEETTVDGSVDTEKVAKRVEIELGTRQGRRYPLNTERPGFIHPSPEPLRASMDKQKEMKSEIRELINLSLANIKTTMVSAEGREIENEGLEAGLANIGLTLEAGERKILEYWNNYENKTDKGMITYPKAYQMKSDIERLKEASEKLKIAAAVSSNQYRKEIAKDIIFTTIAQKITPETLESIISEINASPTPLIDVEMLLQAKEMGLMSDEFAAVAIGMPPGEAAKGAKDHALRLARIQEAQTDPNENADGAVTGNSDASSGSDVAKDQKTVSQSADNNAAGTKKVRGKARRY